MDDLSYYGSGHDDMASEIDLMDKKDKQDKFIFSAFVLAICIILAFLLIVFCTLPGCAHAQEVPHPEAIATAIWHAEGGTLTHWPYGIKHHHYKHTTARQACLNTINHRLRLWNGQGDPIAWIGLTYSPPAINPNWVRLVKFYLKKGNN